jgi:hypothetical protein
MSLTLDEIETMLAPKTRKTGKSAKVRVWNAETSSFIPRDSKIHDLGTFHGRAGTVKRSRKGRTYRAPNGVRKTFPWNPAEVTAYIVK